MNKRIYPSFERGLDLGPNAKKPKYAEEGMNLYQFPNGINKGFNIESRDRGVYYPLDMTTNCEFLMPDIFQNKSLYYDKIKGGSMLFSIVNESLKDLSKSQMVGMGFETMEYFNQKCAIDQIENMIKIKEKTGYVPKYGEYYNHHKNKMFGVEIEDKEAKINVYESLDGFNDDCFRFINPDFWKYSAIFQGILLETTDNINSLTEKDFFNTNTRNFDKKNYIGDSIKSGSVAKYGRLIYGVNPLSLSANKQNGIAPLEPYEGQRIYINAKPYVFNYKEYETTAMTLSLVSSYKSLKKEEPIKLDLKNEKIETSEFNIFLGTYHQHENPYDETNIDSPFEKNSKGIYKALLSKDQYDSMTDRLSDCGNFYVYLGY